MIQSVLPDHDAGRRGFLRRGGALVAAGGLLVLVPGLVLAREPWERLEAARDVIGERTPRSDGIRLELPLVSEDGSSVPLTVSVDSPMAADDHVESIYLFASGNPNPEIAEFRFSPRSGRAKVATRVRLNESQAVIAVARTSGGEILATSRDVRVTVSGCLTRNDDADVAPMQQPRVRVSTNANGDGPAEVLTLINHPMETGLREGNDGQPVPRRIIEHFRAELDDQPVFEARLFQAVSANPFLRFYLAPEAGELRFTWTEDTGETAALSEVLDPA
ncbi:MAG: thiosulfate oxidation carrier complex protein SoxZ [Ectothiorhodospiraceae bacterium]|nr:thiosulfate oxidation carrier complex protein SoxZ [Ectothiorhodospiraceae bacterium]